MPGDELVAGVCQLHAGTNNAASNVMRAEAAVARLAESGAELILLPEFFNVTYFAQDWDYGHLQLAESETGETISSLREIAIRHRVTLCAAIFEDRDPGVRFDTAFVIDDKGDIIHRYQKVHAPAIRGLEKIYYRPGSQLTTFRLGGFSIGIATCYDNYFPEHVRTLCLKGAHVVLAPFAASPQPLWRELFAVRAFENGCYVLVANKCGREPSGWNNGGHSLIVDPYGAVLVEGGQDEGEWLLTLSMGDVRRARDLYPMYRDRRPELYEALTRQPDEEAL